MPNIIEQLKNSIKNREQIVQEANSEMIEYLASLITQSYEGTHIEKLLNRTRIFKRRDFLLNQCNQRPRFLDFDYHEQCFKKYVEIKESDLALLRRGPTLARIGLTQTIHTGWRVLHEWLYKWKPELKKCTELPELGDIDDETLSLVETLRIPKPPEKFVEVLGSKILKSTTTIGSEFIYFQELDKEIVQHLVTLEAYQGEHFARQIVPIFKKSYSKIPQFYGSEGIISRTNLLEYTENYYPYFQSSLVCPYQCGDAFSQPFLEGCESEYQKQIKSLLSLYPNVKPTNGDTSMHELIIAINRSAAQDKHYFDLRSDLFKDIQYRIPDFNPIF